MSPIELKVEHEREGRRGDEKRVKEKRREGREGKGSDRGKERE